MLGQVRNRNPDQSLSHSGNTSSVLPPDLKIPHIPCSQDCYCVSHRLLFPFSPRDCEPDQQRSARNCCNGSIVFYQHQKHGFLSFCQNITDMVGRSYYHFLPVQLGTGSCNPTWSPRIIQHHLPVCNIAK